MDSPERQPGRSAREYLELIRDGRLSSVELVQHCLTAIEQTDGVIGAWAYVDKDNALEQARRMDDIRRRGQPMGKLHGLPVGLKDIIDTGDMPTERGSVIFRDRIPESDAAVVERLKEAGAVILGKTVTTEMAYMNASKTKNPHDFEYGPGGSSSGSAAAVAAGQVPLAIGSQTNGSTMTLILTNTLPFGRQILRMIRTGDHWERARIGTDGDWQPVRERDTATSNGGMDGS